MKRLRWKDVGLDRAIKETGRALERLLKDAPQVTLEEYRDYHVILSPDKDHPLIDPDAAGTVDPPVHRVRPFKPKGLDLTAGGKPPIYPL